jgi:hypothetical protein
MKTPSFSSTVDYFKQLTVIIVTIEWIGFYKLEGCA